MTLKKLQSIAADAIVWVAAFCVVVPLMGFAVDILEIVTGQAK